MSFALEQRSNIKVGDSSSNSRPSVSSKSYRSSNLAPGSYDSITNPQGLIGSQATRRPMPTNLGFDFSKIGILQPKSKVSYPNDPYEQEADRVADQVINGTTRPPSHYNGYPGQAERISGSFDGLQGSRTGKPLENSIRDFMEPRFGFDFSHVRIHDNPDSSRDAAFINSRAFTYRNEIFLGMNESQSDMRLMAHELAHVVQQADKGKAMVQRTPDEEKPKDAETLLGEKLWTEFPSGVNMTFYDANLDEAVRRSSAWAKTFDAAGLKGSKIAADHIAFGKAIPDTLTLKNTLVGIGNITQRAAAKALQAQGLKPDAAAAPGKIKTLAIFSHGTRQWCGLGGGITNDTAASLVKGITPAVSNDFKVILYTCNSARGTSEEERWVKGTMKGGGAGSLGDAIRDAMVDEGITGGQVWGHTTTGHTSTNPALRFFEALYGKNFEGRAYAGEHVWTPLEHAGLVFDLTLMIQSMGYVIDEKAASKFNSKALYEIQMLMYKCYINANKNLKYNGKNLAEMAPMHPNEVKAIIRKHWDNNYWIETKKESIAKKLIKSARLKKLEK